MFDKIKSFIAAVISSIAFITTWFSQKSPPSTIIKNPIPNDSIIEICDNNIAIAEDVIKNSENAEAISYARAVIEENRRYKLQFTHTSDAGSKNV